MKYLHYQFNMVILFIKSAGLFVSLHILHPFFFGKKCLWPFLYHLKKRNNLFYKLLQLQPPFYSLKPAKKYYPFHISQSAQRTGEIKGGHQRPEILLLLMTGFVILELIKESLVHSICEVLFFSFITYKLYIIC